MKKRTSENRTTENRRNQGMSVSESSLQEMDTKLGMILFKIEPTPRKLLYFVNRHSVELSEIGPHFRNWSAFKD